MFLICLQNTLSSIADNLEKINRCVHLLILHGYCLLVDASGGNPCVRRESPGQAGNRPLARNKILPVLNILKNLKHVNDFRSRQ